MHKCSYSDDHGTLGLQAFGSPAPGGDYMVGGLRQQHFSRQDALGTMDAHEW